jgi:dihydrolipoamide dehydrogenase
VKFDPVSGGIQVNERYATSAEDIFAIGDIIIGPMLAHKAQGEGIAVAELLAGKPGNVNYEAIPNVVYTWPEVSSVGLSEEQAQEKARATGIGIRVATFPFSANARARTMDEQDGLVKIIAEEGTNLLLGIHIIGPHASELIAEAVLAIELKAPVEDIAWTSHAHPTLAEAMKEATLGVLKRPLHA